MAMLGYAWINTAPPMTFFCPQERKKINWIELQNPPCFHTFGKVYVSIGSALVSCTPQHSIHFQIQYPLHASDTHTCFILRSTPPVPIRFWQKVRGWPPSIHLKKCRSTPLTPEPVGVGDARMILPVIMAQAETVRGTEMFQESCNSSVPRLNWSKASVSWLAAVV